MIFKGIQIHLSNPTNFRVLTRRLSYSTRPSLLCVSRISTFQDLKPVRWYEPRRFLVSQVLDRDRKHEIESCGDEGFPQKISIEKYENDEDVMSMLRKEEVQEVPWYLRNDSPQISVQTIPERQRIPDLPEMPPPILEPLMNHISVNLGLDYLSLLDLRKLEPPPALGANLLMLIATARSERHLHVSADRLCRWLRSEYKLRPDADGLLGRNELKTRLKRKANRARLMARHSESTDDGIRSDWICVDIGTVESGILVTSEVIDPKKFIGFGQRSNGVRIVTQLLTAEKREEIELEKLWTGILKKGSLLKEPTQVDEIELFDPKK